MTYTISTASVVFFVALALWELVWKGLALWRAGRRGQPVWFGILLVINTAGLLPIYYLLTHPALKRPVPGITKGDA